MKNMRRKMITENYTGLKDPLLDRMRVLVREVWDSVSDPYCLQNSFFDNVREGIDMYRYDICEQMTERSIGLPEVKWTYDRHLGLFVNKDTEETRLVLVLPKRGHTKYIYAQTESGKKIVSALPYEFHREIVSATEEMSGENVYGISGGHIDVSKKLFSKRSLVLSGSSVDFGRANHQEVADVLRKHGLETIVQEERRSL